MGDSLTRCSNMEVDHLPFDLAAMFHFHLSSRECNVYICERNHASGKKLDILKCFAAQINLQDRSIQIWGHKTGKSAVRNNVSRSTSPRLGLESNSILRKQKTHTLLHAQFLDYLVPKQLIVLTTDPSTNGLRGFFFLCLRISKTSARNQDLTSCSGFLARCRDPVDCTDGSINLLAFR